MVLFSLSLFQGDRLMVSITRCRGGDDRRAAPNEGNERGGGFAARERAYVRNMFGGLCRGRRDPTAPPMQARAAQGVRRSMVPTGGELPDL